MTVGAGTANGTFGELLQGALPPGALLPGGAPGGAGRFLVTLPLARWSSARFEISEPGAGLVVDPGHKTKAAGLAAAVLTELGAGPDGVLRLRSDIPEGKGLASSSADLVAAARAIGAALGRTVPRDRLGELLAGIEPTDGVMHPGIVAFDHHRGVRLRSLGRLPRLRVVAVDQGGRVDTVALNGAAARFGTADRRRYARLLDELAVAVAAGDLVEVGRIATASAVLNQERLPNRNLVALHHICHRVGGLGLVACHSGTMIGILLDPRAAGHRSRLSRCVALAGHLPGRTHLFSTLGW